MPSVDVGTLIELIESGLQDPNHLKLCALCGELRSSEQGRFS
jgi:hypothetical protein